jgi:hypothetical protein
MNIPVHGFIYAFVYAFYAFVGVLHQQTCAR